MKAESEYFNNLLGNDVGCSCSSTVPETDYLTIQYITDLRKSNNIYKPFYNKYQELTDVIINKCQKYLQQH